MRSRLAIYASLAMMISGAAASVSQARTMYDGDWAVDVTGRTEACMGSVRYILRIANGIISYGGGDATVSGRVSARGGVLVRVLAHGQSAVGSGRLSRNYGSGTFRGHASTGVCAGTWSGQRVS